MQCFDQLAQLSRCVSASLKHEPQKGLKMSKVNIGRIGALMRSTVPLCAASVVPAVHFWEQTAASQCQLMFRKPAGGP
jgi:hypothetical protein